MLPQTTTTIPNQKQKFWEAYEYFEGVVKIWFLIPQVSDNAGGDNNLK